MVEMTQRPWLLKRNKITLATRCTFLFVLDNLTCFTFYLSLSSPQNLCSHNLQRTSFLDVWHGYQGRTGQREQTAHRVRWWHWHQEVPSLGTRNTAELWIKCHMSSGREWLTLPEVDLHQEECLVVFGDLWSIGSPQRRLTIPLCSSALPRLDFWS